MLSPFLGLDFFVVFLNLWESSVYQLCDFDSRCALIFPRDLLMEICLSHLNLVSKSLAVLGIALDSPSH